MLDTIGLDQLAEDLAHPMPDPVTMSSVISIASELTTYEQQPASLETWLETAPLVRKQDTDHHLSTHPLEESLAQRLRHLGSVCWRPHDRLRVVEEIDPVQRARRPAATAIAHLAAHSEHWHSRTVHGIRPTHVLAQRYDDDIDLYENRVAGRLVEHLLAHLTARLTQVSDLAAMAADIKRYQDQLLTGRSSYRNAARLWKLIAEYAQHTDDQRTRADDLLRRLRIAYQAVIALLGSRVLREVDRSKSISLVLTPTTLFTGEDRYREVNTLWRHWVKSRQRQTLQAAQRYRDLCPAFERYVLLLVLRACEYLELMPHGNETPVPGGLIPLRSREGHRYQLSWRTDGTFVIQSEGTMTAHIVPLALALTTLPSETELARGLTAVKQAAVAARLAEATGVAGGTTIIVYPGRRDERDHLPSSLRHRAHALGPTDAADPSKGQVGLIPVSPLEIDSIERIARSLRSAIATPRLLSYPPREVLPTSQLAKLVSAGSNGWLTASSRQVAAVRPPTSEELARTLSALQAQRTTTSRAWQRGDNQATTDQTARAIDTLRRSIDLLATCPMCGTVQDVRSRGFVARSQDTFLCTCTECAAEWGLRTCGACQLRYPILLANGQVFTGGDGDTIDRTYGNELLAVPCWRVLLSDDHLGQNRDSVRPTQHFICSWCAACPNAKAPGLPCERCAAGR